MVKLKTTWNKGKTKEEFPQLSNSGVKVGNIPWNKGKSGYKAIGKKKGVCDNTGKTHFKKGQIPWNKGLTYKQPEGTGKKISQALLGHKNWYIGKYTENEAQLKRLERTRKRDQIIKFYGSHTQEEWELLKAKYGNICLCCKGEDVKLTKDHILPLSRGGTDKIENIQPLCMLCNNRKFTKSTSFLPLAHKIMKEKEVDSLIN